MIPLDTTFVPLINHKLIQLTLSIPVGKEMYTIIEEGTEDGTGFSRDFVTVDWKGERQTHYFQGPTLLGLGPKVAKYERERLILLRKQVDDALSQVEGFLQFFESRKKE